MESRHAKTLSRMTQRFWAEETAAGRSNQCDNSGTKSLDRWRDSIKTGIFDDDNCRATRVLARPTIVDKI